MKTTLNWATAVALLCNFSLSHGAELGRLGFVPAGPGEFAFDTGVLKGVVGGQKAAKGLSSVVHIPSGTRMDASMGLLSHYRVFSDGKRYGGGAWEWPAEARLQPNGSVEIRRRAAEDRPFEFTAIYRWVNPTTIDLETIVKAQKDLRAFESFVANYYSKSFTNALVWAQGGSSTAAAPQFVAAEKKLGDWLAFPRDARAGEIINDGRWKLEPNPVAWTLQSRFAKPMSLRMAPALGLTAIMMSAPEDCFALCTPEQNEGHYSMYLSLFGEDIKAGETKRARTRLIILPRFSATEAERAYADFSRR